MSNDGLSTNEKVNLLFKNFMNFTSTLDSKQFYEETALANNTNIFSDNILSSLPPSSPSYNSVTDVTTISSLLETGISDISINATWYTDKTQDNSNNTVGSFQKDASNVILRMEKIKLDYVNNGGAAFVCIDNNGTNILQNIIPSNYASSGYSISLEYEKTDGTLKPIGWLATRSQLAGNAFVGSSVNFGGALFDAKNGIITFYDVNGTPSDVFSGENFYFSATKYIGPKGAAGSSSSVVLDASTGIIISNNEISLDPDTARLTSLDSSLNALESTTATHTSNISVLDTSVNALESTTSTHTSNISVLDTSVNALETTTATHTSNISVLDTSVNALESTTSTHTSNISVLDTSVNALESTTATHTSNISVLDTSVNALESTTATHTSNISVLDTSVNALESSIDQSVATNANPTFNNLTLSSTLNVSADVSFGTNLTVDKAYIGSGDGSEAIFSYSNLNSKATCALRQTLAGHTIVNAKTGTNIWFRTNNDNDIMTLSGSNVGIGTKTPSRKLHVIGDARVSTSLSVGTDLTVTGNLTVNGTTTTLNTTNTDISDSLIGLSSGLSGAPANDAGILINRGDASNAFMGWVESADKFTMGTTVATSTDTGNLSITKGILVADLEGNVTGNVTGDVTGNVTGNATTVTNGVYTSYSVEALSDVTSVGSGAIITTTERIKLSGIETDADVTDASNVAAAGAVMETGNQSISGAKTFSDLFIADNESIKFYSAGTDAKYAIGMFSTGVNGKGFTGSSPSHWAMKFKMKNIGSQGFIFSNDNSDCLVSIRASDGLTYINGKTGIGVDPSNSSYKLSVDGTAYATDISAGNSIKVGSTSITSTSTYLGGTPTAPTAASGTSNTQIATTKFVTDAVASVAGGTGETTTLAVGTSNTEFAVDTSGNTDIAGTLDVSENVSLNSDLAVNGNAYASDISAGSSIKVGATSITSTSTSLGGTLGVTGTATLSSTATVGSTLGVTGATTLSSTLGVTGATTLSSTATVGSTLGVTGATTLSSTLGVTGATTLSSTATVGSTLGVTGATALSSTLNVSADVSFGTNLTVDKAYIGSGGYTGNYASFSHSDFKTSTTDYACLQTTDGKTILNSKFGQVLTFRHHNSDQMTLNAGKLGIGTTTPSDNLDVSGTFRVRSDGSNVLIKTLILGDSNTTHVVHMGTTLGGNSNGIYTGSNVNTNYLSNKITTSEFDDITLNVGRVHTFDKVGFKWDSHLEGGHSGGDGTRTKSVNIFSDQAIISAVGVYVYSDKRIKKDILTVEDDKALIDFRKLNPCTYSYIDTIDRGNKTVYGFIAQEVKEVLPLACTTKTETIPNVYSIADISGTFLILQGGTFDNLEHDLTDASGNVYTNISIAIEGTNREKTYYYIKDIVNSTTIELYEELPSSLYLYNETTGKNQCFVFGQFINNFHTLDKNVIWTVAAAATQEIDRQQQADKVRIAELETKVETLETQLTSVLARLSALENA